jgi:hypothetical protein
MSAELIEQIVTAARRPMMEIAQRRESKYTDGQFHSPFGVPWGVKATGEVGPWFYVPMARDGTTYGPRCDTREELEAHLLKVQQRQDAEFRSELLKMDNDQLQSQAAYWLREGVAA